MKKVIMPITYVIAILITIQGALAACDSFEPLGSCPETDMPLRPSVSYTNSVYEDATYYYLSYDDSNFNVTYRINKITSNNSVDTPLHNEKAQAIIYGNKGHVSIYKLSSPYDLYIEFVNGSNKPLRASNKFDSSVGINITQQYKQSNNIIFNFTYYLKNSNDWVTYDNITIIFNFSIKGKSLTLHNFQSNSNSGAARVNYWKWLSVETNSTEPIHIFHLRNYSVSTTRITYDGDMQSVYNINNKYFMNVISIYDKSMFSELYGTWGTPTRSNAYTVHMNERADYHNKTDNELNYFDETLAVVISDNYLDTTIYNNNNVSPKLSDIKDKWFLFFWGGDPWGWCKVNCSWDYVQRLNNYGFDIKKMALITGDNVPPHPELYNNSKYRDKGGFSDNITGLGGQYAHYTPLNDLYNNSLFFNTTVFKGDFINATNHSMIMRNSDGSLTHLDAYPVSTQVYVPKPERKFDMLGFMWNNLTNIWKQQFFNIDETLDLAYTDYDANSSMNGSKSNQLPYRYGLFNYIRSQGYWVYTENTMPLYTAGMIDAGSGNKGCCRNESELGNLIDYELSQLSTKQFTLQPYWMRYMRNWNDTTSVKFGSHTTDEYDFDRFIVSSIIEKKAPLIIDTGEYSHNLSDNLTILWYYSMKFVIEKAYDSSTSNVSYINNDGYLSVSDGIRIQYEFNAPIIYVEYDNGLIVYANLNRTGWFNTTINGATRLMPPNSLYAYKSDGSFEMFYNDNNLSHWVITPDYIYLHPKNDQTITFSVPNDVYERYTFYGDDSTNGMRNIGETPTLVTSIVTNNVLYLKPTAGRGLSVAGAISAENLCEQSLGAFELVAIGLFVLVAVSIILIMRGSLEDVDLVGVTITVIVVGILILVGIKIISSVIGSGC